MNNIKKFSQLLAGEPFQVTEVDQAMRMTFSNGKGEWDISVDKAIQAQLKEIVDAVVWPTISKAGSEASRTAWLLVQRSPSPEFMEYCLKIMEALPEGQVSPTNVAYLKHRVLMVNDKPQIYGTQFQGSGKDMHVDPIEDADHVDER